MASSSTQPSAASKKSILEPVMILEGHEESTRKPPWRTYHNLCISYFSDGKQMISGSEDQTVRRWDLQAGKEIEGVREVCEEGVHAVGVSRNGRWIVAAGGDDNECGELKVWEVRTGIIRTFEGHSQSITCIDISADSTLLASGVRYGGTIRVWNLKTGKLLFEIPASWSGVGAVRFSQDSKKLAVISSVARCLEVWDVETHRLDIELRWKYARGIVTHAPVIWTAKDQTILAAFNFKDDDYVFARTKDRDYDDRDIDAPKTIYEFDASTLQTVRAPFEGHTNLISGLALSCDGALLASASYDQTIKLWAFESRQLLASFDVRGPDHLIFSPNSHQLAYTTWSDTKIYICDTPPHILATIQSAQEAQPNHINAATNPRLLDSNATHRPVRRNPIQPLIVPRPQRDFSTIYPQERAFLYYLRKMLPFRMSPVRTDQLRDPLNFPATSPLPHKISPSIRATNQLHSDIDSHENARSIPLGAQSSATAPTTFKTRLHHILTWWPARVGRALPPIVDVPLAPGRLRYAAADAPTFDEDLIRDEDYIPSTPPHQKSQQPSTGVQVTTGQHGSGRLCGCF